MKLELTLPRPPSVNSLYANNKHGRNRTARYNAWLQHAGLLLNQQMNDWEMLTGDVQALLITNKGRADLPNLDKAVFDLMTKHKVYRDDSQITSFYMKHDEQCGDLMFIEVGPHEKG